MSESSATVAGSQPQPEAAPAETGLALERLILQKNLLSADQVTVARRFSNEQKVDFSRSLIDLNLMSPEQIFELQRSLADARAAEAKAASPAEASDRMRQERDLRAELKEIAATAVPSDLATQIITRAFMSRATDIHIDPGSQIYRVRFRIDGRLHTILELDPPTGIAIVRGMKINANLNIVEHRHAQDGGMLFFHEGRPRNLRMATLPTKSGEKIVIRVHEPLSVAHAIDSLGLEPEQLELICQLIERPYGAFLVGGPVGSGKTTTLYSSLIQVNHPTRNVMSIEDPVEYFLAGVNQVEIDAKSGLTFGEGLRAILRQDPDVLMIGEIRDEETAQIGIRASLTGVLVFSTIHAADAASVVGSLFNYGIPGYTLANSLQGVVSQRLIRRVCSNCKVEYTPDPSLVKALGIDPDELGDTKFSRGTGCNQCFQTGYFGRVGVFEIMEISDLLRELVLRQSTKEVLRQVARDEGMMTLREAAIRKVMRGLTSVDEVYRVST